MNKKQYWLRGLIVLVIIHFVLWLITLLISLAAADNISKAFAWFPIGLIDFIIAPLTRAGASLGLPNTILGAAILILIMGTVQWSIIGAVAGWLYGKIKNRNKITSG